MIVSLFGANALTLDYAMLQREWLREGGLSSLEGNDTGKENESLHKMIVKIPWYVQLTTYNKLQ